MLRTILIHGGIAGVIVAVAMIAISVPLMGRIPPAWGMAIGYLTMLIALSTVFVAVKRRRDFEGGGVIRFWPAFGLGLAISAVAGIFYVLAWEVTLAVIGGPDVFIDGYIAQLRSGGGDPAGVAASVRQMEDMRHSYADPLFRLPITFTEFFPVGVLVSLVSAGLLRNPRFAPARRDPALTR